MYFTLFRIDKRYFWRRMKKQVAIFASGRGSNADALMTYFQQHESIAVSIIVCNNPTAGVIAIAQKHKVSCKVIDKAQLTDKQYMLSLLDGIDLIVLAGFLWLVPPFLIHHFENQIINIHPSLLPKYGGKGMYGTHVHKAVLANKETETGITIHLVNEEFDKGEILAQHRISLTPDDTLETVQQKIAELEKANFAKSIAMYLTK